MPLLWKEIIAPGDYHTDDGLVTATPERIRHWWKQFKRMKRKGLPVPIPWEHQEGAKPHSAEWLASQAKHNAAFWRDALIDRDGKLWGKLDIPDEDDAAQIEKSVRYVSPEIVPVFFDGDGTPWEDIITHIALTPRPVHYRQQPFGAKPRLSHARCARLSLANRVESELEATVNEADDLYRELFGELREITRRRLANRRRNGRLRGRIASPPIVSDLPPLRKRLSKARKAQPAMTRECGMQLARQQLRAAGVLRDREPEETVRLSHGRGTGAARDEGNRVAAEIVANCNFLRPQKSGVVRRQEW